MVTYEDVIEMFLNAAEATGLSVHPEFWLNTQTLDREFSCTLHPGPCEQAEHRANCAVSIAWGPLDTVLSIDGAEAICEFFHDPDDRCPHLQTENVPPLNVDLSFSLPLDTSGLSASALQALARSLKLRASEHSSRAVETEPSIALAFGDNGIQVDSLTLQQHVELPLWDPEGIGGFFRSGERREGHMTLRRRRDEDEESEEPHPEDWLPHLFAEVLADITHVMEALESSGYAHWSGGSDSPSNSDN